MDILRFRRGRCPHRPARMTQGLSVDVRRGGALPRPLFTIPPSTLRVDTSLYPREALEFRACGRGGAMWASPPTDGFKECGVWADRVVRPYGRSQGVRQSNGGRGTPRVLVPLRFTAWASPPTDGFKECGALGGQGRPPYGHIHRRCSPSYAEGDFLARKAK